MFGSKADSKARYLKFLEKVVVEGVVYTFFFIENSQLKVFDSSEYADDEGNLAPVIPLWSTEVYPRNWIKDYEAIGLKIIPISLDDLHPLLLDLSNQNYLVGVEWNQNGLGAEIPPQQLIDDISDAILRKNQS